MGRGIESAWGASGGGRTPSVWRRYNDFRNAGIQTHPGDWEGVSVRIGADGRPTQVGYRQHGPISAQPYDVALTTADGRPLAGGTPGEEPQVVDGGRDLQEIERQPWAGEGVASVPPRPGGRWAAAPPTPSTSSPRAPGGRARSTSPTTRCTEEAMAIGADLDRLRRAVADLDGAGDAAARLAGVTADLLDAAGNG